jgi:protein-S-isoprenylcysteine O-methyltransferase Ste14
VSRDRTPSWRDGVFAQRGTLLALPALSLAAFGTPSSPSIAVGVPLALLGEAIRCWAVGYSGVTTRSDRVEAPQLTTAGPYAYVRNPLYVGNFLTALGFTIAFTGGDAAAKRTALAIVGLGTMLAVYATIVPLEEAYLRQTFGAEFDDYVARVPPVVPRLSPSRPEYGVYDGSVIARAETRTFATFAAMLAALAVKALLAD